MAKKTEYIVDYISAHEIACKCDKCKGKLTLKFNKPRLDFFQKVSAARHIRGIPLIPVSAYRCPEHPLSQDNPLSAHCQGLAMDFYEKGRDIKETYIFWERVFPWNGIGINEKGGTIHVDDKANRFGRWKYKSKIVLGKKKYLPDYMILSYI